MPKTNLVFEKFNPPDPVRTKHGSRRMYSVYGCRCEPCKECVRIESQKRREKERGSNLPRFSARQVDFIRELIMFEYLKTPTQPVQMHRYMKRLRKIVGSLGIESRKDPFDKDGNFKL